MFGSDRKEPTAPATVGLGGESAARMEADPRAGLELPQATGAAPEPTAPPVFYVDPAVHLWRGRKWCHLMTTGTQADLLHFARRLGLLPEWIQKPNTPTVHFDLSEPKREAAITLGAIPVSSVVMFRACVLPKREAGKTSALAAVVAEMQEARAEKFAELEAELEGGKP